MYLIREEYLKTKKKAIPMTTPRPAIPRENFIQHEHRDSGILPLKFKKKIDFQVQTFVECHFDDESDQRSMIMLILF